MLTSFKTASATSQRRHAQKTCLCLIDHLPKMKDSHLIKILWYLVWWNKRVPWKKNRESLKMDTLLPWNHLQSEKWEKAKKRRRKGHKIFCIWRKIQRKESVLVLYQNAKHYFAAQKHQCIHFVVISNVGQSSLVASLISV